MEWLLNYLPTSLPNQSLLLPRRYLLIKSYYPDAQFQRSNWFKDPLPYLLSAHRFRSLPLRA